LNNRIEIPILTPSVNFINKKHWSFKMKLRNEYQLLIKSEMNKNKIKKSDIKEKWKVVIISNRKRLCDFDNFVAGCKQLLDALSHKHTGFIYDDSPKYLDIEYIQKKNKLNTTEVYRVKI
tara:strand:- start:479 stop:838 length:360 start_codon:yes stop_codon:yes gene_type:complete